MMARRRGRGAGASAARPARRAAADAACRRGRRRIPTQRARQKRGLNENYGRELMELHTLGVDGGYTQEDVDQRGARVHRVDDRQAAPGRQLPLRAADPRRAARRSCSARRSRRAAAQSDGEKVLDILARASVDGDVHLDQAGAPLRLRHAAAGARRSRRGAVPRDRRRHPRGGADDPHVAGVLLGRGLPREGQDARSSSSSPRCAPPAPRSRDAMPLAQAVRQLGMPLYMCQPPTGYPDKAEAWVNTGALLNRMNFALQLVGGRMRGVRAGHEPGRRRARRTTCRRRRPRRSRRRPIATQVAALTLGSPEFQRR